MHENPYDYAANSKLQAPIGYQMTLVTFVPPWAIFWLSPLSWLPFDLSAYVWFALNMALLFICGSMLWKLMTIPYAGSTSSLFPPASAVMLIITFYPALYCLKIGQVGIVLFFSVSLFLYLRTKGKHFSAGICLALALIKPHLFSLLWIAIAYEAIWYYRWRTLLGLAMVLTVSIGILTLFYPHWIGAYLHHIGHPHYIWIGDTSIGGFLNGIGYGSFLPALGSMKIASFAPVMIASFLFLIYLISKSNFSLERYLAIILSLSLFVTPYGWVTDQTLLLLPYLAICRVANQISRKVWLYLLFGGIGLNVALGVVHSSGVMPEYLFFLSPALLAFAYGYFQSLWPTHLYQGTVETAVVTDSPT